MLLLRVADLACGGCGVLAQVKREAERREQEEAAAKKKQMEDELKARAARKAALNAKWGGSSNNLKPSS